jgi:hypothetical protein
LISRAIDTRMKIDDCWIAHVRPRTSSRGKFDSESVTPWYARLPSVVTMSWASHRKMFRSGIESASLQPTYTCAGSCAPSSCWRNSGRSAQLSWCALRPEPGTATTVSIFW